MIEKIVGKTVKKNGQVFYKVRWHGYPPSQDTWEPLRNLKKVKHEVDKYEMQHSTIKKPIENKSRISQVSKTSSSVVKSDIK